jgi:alginate O-acetyltransferase complex protein AlgI
LAESITDVWRRWHISLSSVLRDYLYISLGGNRKGETRTYLNLAIVMLLGGLWHGAKWNFIAWGAYHGLFLCYERWRGKQSIYQHFPLAVRIAITFTLMLFSWVLFRAEDLGSALRYFGAMFAIIPAGSTSVLLAADIYAPLSLVIMAVAALLVFQKMQAHEWSKRNQTWSRFLFLIPLFVISLMVMFSQAFNPFLYFQF